MRVELDLRVFKKDDKTRELFVANFNSAGGDLLHAVSSFIEALPAEELVARDRRHFGQPREVLREGRTICWQMDGGESGRATSVMLKKGDVWRKREPSGVEREPFWVFAVVPKNANQAWLLIEKGGSHSLPTEWRDELVKQFAKAYHGYRLVISAVREASLWSQVENSSSDRLLGFEVALRSPDNPSTTGHAAGFDRGMLRVDRRLYHVPGDAVMGKRLREFRRSFTGRRAPTGIVEVDEPLDFDDLGSDKYEVRLKDNVVEIKATVLNARGEPKIIVFEGGRDPVQSYVMAGTSQGQPTQPQFAAECRSAVKDLAQSGGVALPEKWDTGAWEHPADAVAMEVAVSESPGSSDQAQA
jgi:hypothetical protein